MNCEIEFMPVGSGSKPGDAIVVRYGTNESYELMIIDGGTLETGETLVNHVRNQFGREKHIAHVLLTHSDADHASGLRAVLRELQVDNLWLHVPWAHAAESMGYFKRKDWSIDGLRAAIMREYDLIAEIVEIASNAGVQIGFPFQGTTVGPFQVLSPARTTYALLLPQFDRTPEPDREILGLLGYWIGKQSAFGQLLDTIVTKAQKWITETWEHERLKDGGITSPSNESSAVLYGDVGDGKRVLLTGDAGMRALTWAADYANQLGLPLQGFTFVQVPHHGSRRNVGPAILDRIIGPIRPKDSEKAFSAFISSPKDDETHPRKIVVNAFLRRGAAVLATQGQKLIHYGGFAKRDDYINAVPLNFAAQVEDYD